MHLKKEEEPPLLRVATVCYSVFFPIKEVVMILIILHSHPAGVSFEAFHIKMRQYEHVEYYTFVGNPLIAVGMENSQSLRLEQEQNTVHVSTYIIEDVLGRVELCPRFAPSEDAKVERDVEE